MSPAEHHVFVLGAGRAGRSIAVALAAGGYPVLGLHGRRAPAPGAPAEESGGELSATAVHEAGLVLVTVRDAELEGALAELAAARLAPGAILLHASGASDPSGLGALRAAGHPAGTFHPLVPLADPSEGAARLRGAWIGVEGDPAAREAGRRLATVIGARVMEIPQGEKAAYHAAAVLASNFPVVLAGAAADLLRRVGVDPTAADGAVHALLAGAVANLAGRPLDAPGVAAALTGPVARGDVGTVAAHLAALSADRAVNGAVSDAAPRGGVVRDAYLALSRLTAETMRAAGDSSPRLDELSRMLDGYASGAEPPTA